MAKFEDRFLGWLVLSHDKLKEAIGKLPPQMRTYQAIHEATGIGPQQLSEYVSGKRLPSLINLKRLCLYVGISADELLGIEKIEDETKD
jgi:transcriptional regulator with XRE-family HTH domain